jgi:hypothetical protein
MKRRADGAQEFPNPPASLALDGFSLACPELVRINKFPFFNPPGRLARLVPIELGISYSLYRAVLPAFQIKPHPPQPKAEFQIKKPATRDLVVLPSPSAAILSPLQLRRRQPWSFPYLYHSTACPLTHRTPRGSSPRFTEGETPPFLLPFLARPDLSLPSRALVCPCPVRC